MKSLFFRSVAMVSAGLSCCVHAELPSLDDPSRLGHCQPPLQIRFSCTTEGERKFVSICADGDNLKFLYGKPGSVEVSLPKNADKESVSGWIKTYQPNSERDYPVSEAKLTFRDGEKSYVVADTLSDHELSTFQQIVVTEGAHKVADLRCIQEEFVTGSVDLIVKEAKGIGYSIVEE